MHQPARTNLSLQIRFFSYRKDKAHALRTACIGGIVVSPSMEYDLKARFSLLTLFFLFSTGLPALGQEAAMGGPTYTALNAAPTPSVSQMPKDSDNETGTIAQSLSEHLVVFESRQDPGNKRLRIPFTAFANSPFHLAYDPTSRQMMAQWKFAASGLGGDRLQYQTYMDAAGTLNFVFSARF
jgi:hypothetical protein